MFTYCGNNPVMFLDVSGNKFESAIDTDGDGEPDLYVYSYSYTTGILWWAEERTGHVYIYTGKSQSYFESMKYPEAFDARTDIIVGDYTQSDNPNMYAYQAHKVDSTHHESIINCLLEYDSDYGTNWERTKESLKTEWVWHNNFSFERSAQNIDFDNAEEGKTGWYYINKALSRGGKKLGQFFEQLF